MNLEAAKGLVPLYRQGKQMSDRVVKAVRMVEANEELSARLQEQMDFDDRLIETIRGIQPPPTFRERLTSTATSPKSRSQQASNPAFLCAVFGERGRAGILVFLKIQANEDFPGRDRLETFIDMNEKMSGAEMETTQLPTGQLGDNMMLRGFDGFTVPKEIASLPAVGWRVFRHGPSGHKVAQMAIDKDHLIVFVFRAADLGVRPGGGGEWRIFSHNEWAAAVTERGNLCTLLTFKGEASQMKSFVANLSP
jgi:hypothetical protein